MIVLCFCCSGGGGGGGGDEVNNTLADGDQSGPAGIPSSAGQPLDVRRSMARSQSRHRLANKPQDFQVSLIIVKDP